MSFGQFGIEIGSFTFSYFGLILIIAMVAGSYVAYRAANRAGEDGDLVIDVATWGLIGGVIFARLFYVLNPPPSVAAFYDRRWFLTHPFDLQIGPLAIWSGGLGMAGALVGALLGAGYVLWRNRVNVWKWSDLVIPGGLVFLAIAPLANLLNQQLIGPPTTLPWGVSVLNPPPPYDNPFTYPPDTMFHPTPGYLSLWTLIVFLVLSLWLRRRASEMPVGRKFLLSILMVTPMLFALDFIRIDVARVLIGLTGMQLLSLLLFIAALFFVFSSQQLDVAADEVALDA